MKKTVFKSLSIYLFGVLISLWLITPVMAASPEQGPKDIVQWMNALPEETQTLVMEVFEQNLACTENAGVHGKKGQADASAAVQMSERIYRDLQMVLTAEQLNDFVRLSKNSNPTADRRLSATRATCGDCYWIHQLSLSNAENYLNTAKSLYTTANYNAYNCQQPPWGIPDPIGTMINASILYVERALTKVWAAYSTCDCTNAQDGLDDIQKALQYCRSAISGTISDCDPNPPWLQWLNAAEDWLDHAVGQMADCIAQACN